jgi:hypothetical protein
LGIIPFVTCAAERAYGGVGGKARTYGSGGNHAYLVRAGFYAKTPDILEPCVP